jgi:hypothetical protein
MPNINEEAGAFSTRNPDEITDNYSFKPSIY